MLSCFQFGFQLLSSTQEGIISATTDWHKFLDTKANVAAILSKAFDTIPHSSTLSLMLKSLVHSIDIYPTNNNMWCWTAVLFSINFLMRSLTLRYKNLQNTTLQQLITRKMVCNHYLFRSNCKQTNCLVN